jgi:hypothetical protein
MSSLHTPTSNSSSTTNFPWLSPTENSPGLPSRQSQSHIATDGQSVSHGVEPHLVLMTRYLLPFACYGLVLYMPLALASVVFLGSKSLGTRDHILLSQIWDFPFRRHLRLAGSRWRFLAPFSTRVCLLGYSGSSYNSSAQTSQKTRVTCQTASSLVRYQHWAWRARHRKHSPPVVVWHHCLRENVFT